MSSTSTLRSRGPWLCAGEESNLMCGILGLVQPEPVSVECLREGEQVLFHRGPDGGGEMAEGGVGLAMRRLAIIDVPTGGQPMHFPDGGLSLVYNGEIYNYRSLREELRDSFNFSTTS